MMMMMKTNPFITANFCLYDFDILLPQQEYVAFSHHSRCWILINIAPLRDNFRPVLSFLRIFVLYCLSRGSPMLLPMANGKFILHFPLVLAHQLLAGKCQLPSCSRHLRSLCDPGCSSV